MIVVVQEIKVTWTKKSRGGQAATLRNNIAEAHPFSRVLGNKFPLALVHDEIWFDEKDQFQMSHRKLNVRELIFHEVVNVADAAIRIEKDVLTVHFHLSWGMPSRPSQKVFSLKAGEWGRMTYNARSGLDAEWWYRKTILSIGYMTQVTEDVFLNKPHYTFSNLADLW